MEPEKQELSFRSIAEASPIALILVNSDGKIVFLNKFTENLLAYDRSELTGQELKILFPDMYRFQSTDFWVSYFTNPDRQEFGDNEDLTAQTKTGKRFPAEVKMNPINSGKKLYTLIAVTDITERKKASEQFRLVVESAPNAMILTDSKGRIAMVNKQTELLFGYNRNELISRKIEILVPRRMKQHHPEHRENFYAHPKSRPMGAGRDLYGLKKDGTEIPIEIGLNPVEKDGAQFVLASVIDITERKKNEEAIRLYARQIEEKNKELEEFTNVASHDLREPLNSIIGLTDLLMKKKSDQLDEDGKKMLDYIGKSASRMAEMIIGLLDYARLAHNKKLILTDMNELAQTVILDLDASVAASNAKITVGNLPTIHIYAMQMRLLFQNLISNALKYKKSDVSPQITISAIQVKNGWEFTISDNGIGIPETQQEKVFNLFHRLHGNNAYEGSGIGLAHCRKITELHKGKIWVESELDRGSSFCFFIPSQLNQM